MFEKFFNRSGKKKPSETPKEEEAKQNDLSLLAKKYARKKVGDQPERQDFSNEAFYYRACEKYWNRHREAVDEFFLKESVDAKIFRIVDSIARYIKENNIANLVMVDRAARPLHIGISEYWKNKFPDTKKPAMYFINPKGFKSKRLPKSELIRARVSAACKNDIDENISTVKYEDEILEEFKRVYAALILEKSKPTLIVDTCLHSGETLKSILKIFDKLGFDNVKIATINYPEGKSNIKPDLTVFSPNEDESCYSFGEEGMVSKTFEHTYSLPNTDPSERQIGIGRREDIKQIVREKLQER